MYDRSHLGRQPLAHVPRSPREHLRQPLPRSRERLHRGHGRGQGPARWRHPSLPRHRQASEHGVSGVVCGRRRELRGRIVPRARGDGTPVPGRGRDPGPLVRSDPCDEPEETGMLPLVFADPGIYAAIGEDDHISVFGLASLAPERPVRCAVVKLDGTTMAFSCGHSFSEEQITWFQAGARSTSFDASTPQGRADRAGCDPAVVGSCRVGGVRAVRTGVHNGSRTGRSHRG